MRITKGTSAGAALVAVVMLAGCGASKAADSPVTAAPVTTTVAAASSASRAASSTPSAVSGSPVVDPSASATTAVTTAVIAPDTAPLDQMLKDLDRQLAAGNDALDDATAAMNSGEGDVNP